MLVEKDKLTVNFIEIRESSDGLTRVYFSKILRRSGGGEKLWNGTAIVNDKNLVTQLEKVQNGAEIEIEIVTDWREQGAPVFLIAFHETGCPDSQSEISKNNGTIVNTATTGEFALP